MNSQFAYQQFQQQQQQQQQQQPPQPPPPQGAFFDGRNMAARSAFAGSLGVASGEYRRPEPPRTKQELQALYRRWQQLKAELGDRAPQSQELQDLQKILTSFTQQQQQYHQQRAQQQQADASKAKPPQGLAAQQFAFRHSQLGQGQQSPPAAAPQPSALQPGAQVSPAPQLAKQGPAGPATAPQSPSQSPFKPIYTQEQIVLLKNQSAAFQALHKGLPVPPQVAEALFGKAEPSAASPAHALPAASPRQNGPARAPDTREAATPDPHAQERQATRLGVAAMVPPQSFVKEHETYPEFNRPHALIASLMPVGLDWAAIKGAREHSIAARMAARYLQLSHARDLSLEEKVELKALRLSDYLKGVRGDLLAHLYHMWSCGVNETNRINFTRMKTQTLLEAQHTEQYDSRQRRGKIMRDNELKITHLNNMQNHAIAITQYGRVLRVGRRAKLGKSVASFHHMTEKEEQKRAERTAKQRLQALRANDEEAYIKLLDQTKDTRITHLLRQTNTFLDSLVAAVKEQQRENKQAVVPADKDEEPMVGVLPDEDGDEEDGAAKIDYYAVAHRIKEPIVKQPSILVGGQLKEYQLKGLQWMVSLFNNNLNGILADEMGLGKTIQSISLITYLIEAKRIPGPYLVIVPLSTLQNWTLEFQKWAPSVKVVIYKGPPQARKAQQMHLRADNFQVVLTTYEYVIKDRPVLARIKWVHMIIDEGHRMKNANSKLSSTLTQYYSTRYRLILTGTPLQNNLPELWAILNFVLPKIFNSVKSFDEWFNTPFANTGGQDKMDLSEEETLLIIRRLHKVLRPFLLRRLKKDVEKDLPDKVEKVLKCKMSALQSKLYQQMIKHRVLFLGENAQGATTSGLKGLNNQIMQLRKICNHPFVFEEVENIINPTRGTNDLLWRTAGKFEILDRILPKFQRTNHRVLIFFQMTQIMDIMEDFLRMRGMQYLRLDGSTKAEDRSELLRAFNAPDSPYFAFLLSTRAGGLGLNLQTADTVIIYDTDWNPHQDLQAQDRAHRIGQTKEVRILRLITAGSVEENILERAHQKLEIDGKVIQAGKFDNKSTSEEQEAFLRSLLEAEEAKRTHKDEEDEDMDEEELNDILARDDDEKEIFRMLDRERIANSPYGRNKEKERLIQESELPEVYKRDINEILVKEPVGTFGRGARERREVHYDDGLTEEQWLDAMDDDNDSVDDASLRKRAARSGKRKANKMARAEAGSLSPYAGEEDSPMSPGGRRKRARKPLIKDDEILSEVGDPNSLAAAPPKKRTKGRPPKVKETLTAAQRQKFTEDAMSIFDYLKAQTDDAGRSRIEIFLELPSKRIYPDYYVLIRNPIACDTIMKRIQNSTYQSLGELRADFKLMFDNARVYNEEGSFVYEDANELEKALRKKIAEIVPESENQKDGATAGDKVDSRFLETHAANAAPHQQAFGASHDAHVGQHLNDESMRAAQSAAIGVSHQLSQNDFAGVSHQAEQKITQNMPQQFSQNPARINHLATSEAHAHDLSQQSGYSGEGAQQTEQLPGAEELLNSELMRDDVDISHGFDESFLDFGNDDWH